MVCATSKPSDQPAHTHSLWAYAQSDQSLCLSLEYSMTVQLLTKHHLEFLLHRLFRVYTCQNATLLEITFCGSFTISPPNICCGAHWNHLLGMLPISAHTIWASMPQNLFSGFQTKRESNMSPQLQRLAR